MPPLVSAFYNLPRGSPVAAYSYIEGNPVPDQERQETRPVLLYHYAGNTLPRGSPAAAGVHIANRSLVELSDDSGQGMNAAGGTVGASDPPANASAYRCLPVCASST